MSKKKEQTTEVKKVETRGRKKGSSSPRPDKAINISPGDMGKYMNNALEIFNLPPIDTDDAEAVGVRLGEYFTICGKNGMKPSVAGMAMALGISRITLWEWVTTGRKGAEVTNTLKRGYQLLNQVMEDYMQNGQINPVAGIFLMKNNFNYRDQQEMVVTPNTPLGELRNTEDLRQKYLDSVAIEVLPDNEENE